jgi:hypothetical protein
MALMSMMAGADGAASGAAGMSNPALGPEAMAKILGMFAGQDANYLQRMQAMKPTFFCHFLRKIPYPGLRGLTKYRKSLGNLLYC